MGKPFFNKTKQRWFVRIDGKQINLGADEDEARRKFRQLMAGQTTASIDVTAAEIIEEYLVWSRDHQAASTYQAYAYYLVPFRESIGSLKLSELKPFHVTRWIDKKKLKGNTANLAVRCIVRPFAWALKMGVIEVNPLAKVERPAATPRECYISKEQFTKLIEAVTDDEFRDLLTILRETGCRPQEARNMEARHFKRDTQTIVFPREESKGKRRQRVIVLTPAALAVVQRLAMKNPEGPIFRNTEGEPWKSMAIVNRFGRLSAKLKFEVSAYVLRHAWVTDALMNGVEPLTVATLAGHASIKMIWQVYQSLQMQTDHMREAALKAVSRVG